MRCAGTLNYADQYYKKLFKFFQKFPYGRATAGHESPSPPLSCAQPFKHALHHAMIF